jgi:signal transduction histidine kinase
VVTVSDDGQGMSAEPGIGYGLLGMRERVKALGGSLQVSSGLGAGLVVTAALPQDPRRRVPTAAAVA